MVRRTCLILRAVHASGGGYILEHPADRGCLSSTHYLLPDHAPIWIYPDVAETAAAHSASLLTFPQCAFGAKSQ
eukprot:4952100-Pleurochrysis_carterae.AAC.1